jgi:hypothetical protein
MELPVNSWGGTTDSDRPIAPARLVIKRFRCQLYGARSSCRNASVSFDASEVEPAGVPLESVQCRATIFLQ